MNLFKSRTLSISFVATLFFIVGISPNKAIGKEGKAHLTQLKVGHVGHDHHLGLFVALDMTQKVGKEGVSIKKLKDKKFYELLRNGQKVAELEIVKVGGGSKMPTALAQDVIDIGFGGVAPVLAAIDKGAPIKLISPLHFKGDMFVLRPDFPAANWKEFVAHVKKNKQPVRIGYKSPMAVAKVIFEKALAHEGLTFSGNPADTKVDVLMINVKGGGKLNIALANGLVDGYAGNNPFPAIGEDKKILKIVSDLEDLPPGDFKDHPCCCIAANDKAIKSKSSAITDLLTLVLEANKTINKDLPKAAEIATRWIGTKKEVELKSIPTSGFDMKPDATWHGHMKVWLDAMNKLGLFKGKLKGLPEDKVAKIAYDFSSLTSAE